MYVQGEIVSPVVTDSAIAAIVVAAILGTGVLVTLIYSCVQTCGEENIMRVALLQAVPESSLI